MNRRNENKILVGAPITATKNLPTLASARTGVKREPSTIRPLAIFDAACGTRDWQVVTEAAVWVTNEQAIQSTGRTSTPKR